MFAGRSGTKNDAVNGGGDLGCSDRVSPLQRIIDMTRVFGCAFNLMQCDILELPGLVSGSPCSPD
jgi:hypothetical protein